MIGVYRRAHDVDFGYGSEQWTVETDYAVLVSADLGLCGVLTEPTSVVAKAWEQIERIGARAWFAPRSVLVTGAGPIGLLAAPLGVQRGLDVHVLDRVTDGTKPDLVRDLGATVRRPRGRGGCRLAAGGGEHRGPRDHRVTRPPSLPKDHRVSAGRAGRRVHAASPSTGSTT
ncbi:hypothetical protein [uncultured Nocardioides sp.]|uniref:Glucose 1-dehydrogenase n=1 Tax=uncultured Nocardioides sp. TaxID=198441 RepID=A0A6J4NSQ6_9ACTN|nr:hypothetical protein [uncultured Nocardioides sp.]CAA9394073.1 MAG: Glucose 1-dehydrogenase [uncultured Nocardioides sp.]